MCSWSAAAVESEVDVPLNDNVCMYVYSAHTSRDAELMPLRSAHWHLSNLTEFYYIEDHARQ